MAWQNPKTDWVTNPKNPIAEDFNRIEGNIDFLKQEIETKKGAIVDALNEVGISADLTDTHAQLAGKITSANQGTKIITPSTANQAIPKGFHSGQGYVIGDPDLIEDNIRHGKNIFNIVGTYGELQDVLLYPQNFSLSQRQAILAAHLNTINADNYMPYLVVENPLLHDAIIQSPTLLPATVSKFNIWQRMLYSKTAMDKILGNSTYFNYIKSQYGGLNLFKGSDPANVEFVQAPYFFTPDSGDEFSFERQSDCIYMCYSFYGSPYVGITTKLSFDLTNVNSVEVRWSGTQSSTIYNASTRVLISPNGIESANPSGAPVSITKREVLSWGPETQILDVSGLSGYYWIKVSHWDGVNNHRDIMTTKLYELILK